MLWKIVSGNVKYRLPNTHAMTHIQRDIKQQTMYNTTAEANDGY